MHKCHAGMNDLEVAAALTAMRGRRVIVVGDIMIDEWIWGGVTRISPEAPVPVVSVSNHSFTLGGAGNVAKNLQSLGAQVTLLAGVGNDSFGSMVHTMLVEDGITAQLIKLSDRPTTRKTRVVAHNQQVVRVDWETVAPLQASDRAQFVEYLRDAAVDADAIIFSDYAKGVLSEEIVHAADACAVIVADPKPQNADMFKGVTCIAPNLGEAAHASGIAINDTATLEEAGSRLLARLSCRYAIITRGENGMSLFGNGGERLNVPSVARAVYDVSGAGDTVIALLALALAAHHPIDIAMQLATYAAGTVVEKLGTATASAEEIISMAGRLANDDEWRQVFLPRDATPRSTSDMDVLEAQ